MKKILCLYAILVAIINCTNAQGVERRSKIGHLFDSMEMEGIDTKKPLLYGYFFYDNDKLKLERLRDELLKEGYRLVRLEIAKKQTYILHVEKVEIHSRNSLFARDIELEKLSQKFQIELFDGWDVGNSDPSKPLITLNEFKKIMDGKAEKEVYKIAMDLYDNNVYDKAMIAFQVCVENNYRSDTCYYKQGVIYRDSGKPALAIEKSIQALKINPFYFKACFNIAAIYYDELQFEKSIEYYQKAAKIEPNNDAVYYGIAASQFVLKKFKEAETNCQAALLLNPDNENAKALLLRVKLEK